MSTRSRRSVGEPDARPFDEAAARDRALADRDWTVPPPGSRTFRFPAPSGALAATVIGEPGHPRVVLVPGATGSKEDFVLLAPLLAEAGYLVESYDLAGQSGSAAAGPPGGEPFGYGLFVTDLIALLANGASPSHVLGYSFAGIVAEIALTERPDLFASLTLLGAPPQAGQVFRRVRWIGALSWLIPARGIASLLIWGLLTNRNHAPPGRLALVRARFDATSRRSVDDIVGLMKRSPDVRRLLFESPIPMLVAVGEHDLWPTGLHRAFANRIGAACRVYATGHSPCETTPHQLARDMVALFQGRL
ncbi:alpha/beta hydrolase [Cryobacterium sp. PH31-AA6]|uniref:alpha/beta fold hydrolase n=1 Tax=Cryobacterium sp. PH31-AA6 TaxID=3046205 RepID=UPI0024BA980C|nr:alpha/beta hydrolase [Cryobacterium sp. PH31-AA6]MDJ0322837.1 alpha/beta hydrolase [Cryobacterium sp. PH31-AA6]